MNSVTLGEYFVKKAKRLLKKYHTLEKSLKQLEQDLLINPYLGVSYGASILK